MSLCEKDKNYKGMLPLIIFNYYFTLQLLHFSKKQVYLFMIIFLINKKKLFILNKKYILSKNYLFCPKDALNN